MAQSWFRNGELVEQLRSFHSEEHYADGSTADLLVLVASSGQALTELNLAAPSRLPRITRGFIGRTVVDDIPNVPALFHNPGTEIHETHQADFDRLSHSGRNRDSRYRLR